MNPSWWIRESLGGFPTALTHACGAELRRTGPGQWQLEFGGRYRALSGRYAPTRKAERALEEMSRAVLGGSP